MTIDRLPFKSYLPHVTLFLAFVCLRHQSITDLQMGYGKAWSVAHLWLGYLYDLVVVLLVAVFARVLWLFRVPPTWSWCLAATTVFVASLGNVIYFRFFGTQLELWTLKLHWSDFTMVHGSAGSLGFSGPILFGLVLLVLGMVARLKFPPRPALRFLAATGSLLLFALLLRQSPVWFKVVHFNDYGPQLSAKSTGTILSNQILTVWWTDLTSTRNNLDQALAQNLQEFSGSELAANLDSYRQYQVAQSRRSDVNRKLGLGSRPNILILFLESGRAFELDHPALGPIIWPNLRRVLAQHSVYFTQAYSSSFNAGQTIRGQFSTLCSMLPNVTGPAAYLAYPNIRVRCLQQIFKENGYATLWMNGFESTFHNKGLFESTHGMQHFYDIRYFSKLPLAYPIRQWGIDDKDFLNQIVPILEKHAGGRFFGHALNVGTHHPYTFTAAGGLPPQLLSDTRAHPSYQAYLSRLRYLDQALGNFFTQFFNSPISNNTVVVLLGDHSAGVRPHLKLTDIQAREMAFRIPIALISKHLAKPLRVSSPVHQVDVAPTLARLAGLPAEPSWMGQGLLSGNGRPWLYQFQNAIFYRTKKRGCYTHTAGIRCLDLSKIGTDPLFQTRIREIPEDHGETRFFRRVIKANRLAISLNRVITN